MPALNMMPFHALEVYIQHSPLRCSGQVEHSEVTLSRGQDALYHPPRVPGDQRSRHASAAHNKSIDERDWS